MNSKGSISGALCVYSSKPTAMRTRLLPTLLVPTLLAAQPDYFANDPVWTVTAVCNQAGMGGGPCITTDTYNYRIDGDSLVGGVSYKVVMRSGSVSHVWIGPLPPPELCDENITYGPLFQGLLRQEGRVLYTHDGNEEVLLYDFDLEVGEMLPLTANNGNDQILVTELDSVEMNGSWKRTFTVQGDWSERIIEGVGSDMGLFEPLSSAFECSYNLDCYGFGGQAYYPEPGPSCELVMGLVELQSDDFSVAPNPTYGPVNVSRIGNGSSMPVDVLDAEGRSCMRTAISGASVQLDLAHLRAGTYVVRVGRLHQRVLVLPRN